jgi:hypothetical protein
LKKIISFQIQRKNYWIFKEKTQDTDFWRLLEYFQ